MDYSNCDFTFFASSAPPYPTDVSESSDMDFVYSDPDFISTPSGSVSKLASPIFTFDSSTPSEPKALFDTIAPRDMSRSIYLIDVSSAPHSSAAVTIEARASSDTCLPRQTVPQSIYIIDFPPSAPGNHAVVATTSSGAKALPIISFSRRAMSGPAQVTDITSPAMNFYNSATATTALVGGTMFGPAQSAECLTSPTVVPHQPTAVTTTTTTTPEIKTPYATFSFPAESRPVQPGFTSYNYTPVTTNAIHGPDQNAEFIAFPTFAPYNPVTSTTPLTYRTISGPPQVEEIIASPVFTFYNSTAVRATSANSQALLAAPFTISSSPQIITLDQVCDAEDEIMEYDNDQDCETEAEKMECDNESGEEENKGRKDEITKRNYGDGIIEEDSMIEEHTGRDGEDKMVVEDIRKEEEDKMIEDEDRNIERVDGGDDSEEEIDQGEVESKGGEEESEDSEGESEEEINKGEVESGGSEEESEEGEQESEDSEDESEDEINTGEVESEESEKESEDSEDENEEEGEESEEKIEESEEESEEENEEESEEESEESEEGEEDNKIKRESKCNKFEVEEAVVGERGSKVKDSGAEDLAIDNRKDGDGEVKDSNFEYSGTEEGNWNAKWNYKSRGESSESGGEPSGAGEAEAVTGSGVGGGNKSEDRSGRENFRGKKEIAEEGDGSVEVEAAQEYQVVVEDEEVEKSEIATVAQLATRKIAPLRRRFPNVLAISTPTTLFLSPSAPSTSTPIRGGEEEVRERKGLDRSEDSDESLSDPESDSGDEALGWAGKVAIAKSELEKAVGAFELSEIAVEIPFDDSVVSAPASTSTYTPAPSDGGSSCESLSEPESDEGDEALGWALPKSEGDHEEKEKITPTSASTLISSPVRNTTATARIWKPPSIFFPNRAFAPASVAIRPRPPPVIITGRWVREHRGSRKEWTWVAEDSTAVPQRDIGIAEDEEEVEEIMAVKTEEEEDAIRTEIFRADMARVQGRGWSWEREVSVEGVTTTAATVPEFTDAGTGDAPLVEDESLSNSSTEPGLITMPAGRWTFPVWPLLLAFVAITLLAWISRVRQSLADNVLWDGIWIVPGTLAWEPIAPLETALFRIGWQLLPIDSGTTALAIFLSVVFADIYAVARGRVAMGSSSSLLGWIVSGAAAVTRGVMRWRGALAMTTTEGRVAFTLPEAVTGAKWEGVKEVGGYEEYLPIEFVSAGDITPAVDMCPRHELGIGAGTGGLRNGAGSSFGLGLFLLGFLVWGSGGRQLRRSAGGV